MVDGQIDWLAACVALGGVMIAAGIFALTRPRRTICGWCGRPAVVGPNGKGCHVGLSDKADLAADADHDAVPLYRTIERRIMLPIMACLGCVVLACMILFAVVAEY